MTGYRVELTNMAVLNVLAHDFHSALDLVEDYLEINDVPDGVDVESISIGASNVITHETNVALQDEVNAHEQDH